MAVNKYFNNFPSQERMTGESLLMESIIDESIQIMGHNIYYIPRESVDNADLIFGEATKIRFEHAYLIEAYIANVEGFEGDNDFFSKFGLEIRDTTNLVVSRRGFSRVMPTTLRRRPQEGDILWVPLMRRMFEIKFIEEELAFFSLGKRNPYIYEMRCEQFRYSQEDFDTGVDDIDEIETDAAFTVRYDMEPYIDNFADYEPGEIVFQGTNQNINTAYATAEVTAWYKANNSLFLRQVSGSFNTNTAIIGATSTARYKLIDLNEHEDQNMYDLRDNEEFFEATTLILDLSELNPFGTP